MSEERYRPPETGRAERRALPVWRLLRSLHSAPSFRLFLLILVVTTAVPVFWACNDDQNGPPGGDQTPGVILVTTAAELDQALLNSVPGDTIQVTAEFSSNIFPLNRSYTIPASRSPLRIVGNRKGAAQRPEIVFPAGVAQGIRFEGHSGSTIANLDFRGGRDVIVLSDSRVKLEDLNVRGAGRYGVDAIGNGTDGSDVDSCLFEEPGTFGVHAIQGADITIRHNTIVGAGDCGLFIDTNTTMENNNIVNSVNQGIHCDANAASPILNCNNSYGNPGGDYVCPTVIDVLKNNYSADPRFCAGTWAPDSSSPLAPANSGGCGLIGKFAVGCDPGN